jgi:hypothetical protein
VAVVAFVHGLVTGGGPQGYIQSYDPHTPDGRGDLVITQDIAHAKRWPGLREFAEDRHTVNRHRPKRPGDGGPNRPLAAFTVEIRQVP